ncbi:MAG: hypothetical protein KQH59_01675 [Desulfobulbaceae bacterium]|nr:hypothetical protein [Desulfobulbaceae bacterium]
MAKDLSLDFRHLIQPVDILHSYTLADTWKIVSQFMEFCAKPGDGLLILDHRNLLLTPKLIRHAINVFERSPETSVVSLAPCLDPPCQYHAFSIFIDCMIIDFNKISEGNNRLCFSRTLPVLIPRKNYRQISLEVHAYHETDSLLVTLNFLESKGDYILQFLPFSEDGLLFEESFDIFAHEPIEKQLVSRISHWSGIICIISTLPELGEYDSVEVFSPPKATWEIRESGLALFKKQDHQSINGRQQFPEAYAYDGSLCLASYFDLLRDPTLITPTPVLMTHSGIVTDWIDYYYAASIRAYHPEVFKVHSQ